MLGDKRGLRTPNPQEFLTLNSEKPPFIRDVEAKVRRYLRSSYSAAWTLKITWDRAPAYGTRGDSRRVRGCRGSGVAGCQKARAAPMGAWTEGADFAKNITPEAPLSATTCSDPPPVLNLVLNPAALLGFLPSRRASPQTNTFQAVLTTDGFRSYVLLLYQDGGMRWDYRQLPAANVLIGYTRYCVWGHSTGMGGSEPGRAIPDSPLFPLRSGDGSYHNDDLTQGPPAAKYRPDQFRGYNTGRDTARGSSAWGWGHPQAGGGIQVVVQQGSP